MSSTTPIKALLFTNLFPSVREPARGVFNLHRFRAVADFCSVRVVVPVPAWRRVGRPIDWISVPSERHSGLEVTYPTSWTLPRVAPHTHAESMYRSVRSHVRQLREAFPFDVVLGGFAYPDVVAAARLARDARCPLVSLVMGSDMNVLAMRPALRPQIREALTQSETVIALSQSLKDKVVELGIPVSRVVVQRNGVDGTRFVIRDRDEARVTLGIDPGTRLICFIGNLVHEKGPDVLIEAVGRMDRSGLPGLAVVFIGDGPLKSDLLSRVSRLGLSGIVRFAGRQSPDQIPHWLAASDCLCLSSRREGCPNVILEALACGRPVVASDVGGVPELLNDRNGILVRSEDANAFAAALRIALQRPWTPMELRTSVNALTWQTVGHTIHDAFRQALENCRAAALGPISIRSLQ